MFALPQSAPWCFSAHAARRRCRWHWRQDHVTSDRLRCPEQCKYPYVPLRHWIRGNSNIKHVKIISSPKAMIPLVGSWILTPRQPDRLTSGYTQRKRRELLLPFFIFYFYIHRSGVLTALTYGWCHIKLQPSRPFLCTTYNHAPYHFMQSHIRKVHAWLAATYHLHFWQNDRDLLRATAVTPGWNGYRNKSQYRKLILEKKILPPLLQGFEPATFQSRVRRSNHELSPLV